MCLNFEKGQFSMGCCCSSSAVGPRGGFHLPSRDHISEFLEANQLAHSAIVSKGPLLPFYGNGEAPRQADQLPRSAFRLYDMDGNETEFHFESESIFSHPISGQSDRVFYDEIYDVRFSPIAGHESQYAQMTFDTKVGFRTFFYVPAEFKSIITRIIKNQSRNDCE